MDNLGVEDNTRLQTKKYFIVLFLLIIALVTSNIFFIYRSLNKVESKEVIDLVETTKKMAVTKDTIVTTTNQNKIYDLLLLPDKDRQDDTVCGYESGELTDKLVISIEKFENTKFESGVWANDCSVYVYGVGVHIPVTSFTEEAIGVWAYYPKVNSNVMLLPTFSNDDHYPQAYTFLSKNLVSAAGSIINVETKKVVDYVDSQVSWTMYRDPSFPWMFMAPADWFVSSSESDFSDNQLSEDNLFYEKLVFVTSDDVKVTFLTEVPEYNLANYSNNYGNNLREYGYAYYFSEGQRPQAIYVLEGDRPYPKVITVEREMSSSTLKVTKVGDVLTDVIKTFENFK